MTPEQRAKQTLDLYFGNKEFALIEVFHAARIYKDKDGDMPAEYWAKVAKFVMEW